MSQRADQAGHDERMDIEDDAAELDAGSREHDHSEGTEKQEHQPRNQE